MQNGIRLKYSAVPVSGIGFKYRGPRTEGALAKRGEGVWNKNMGFVSALILNSLHKY
jgi:hypothetical protein